MQISKTDLELVRKSQETMNQFYSQLVSQMIRTRYSINAELAILRQRDDPDKAEDFRIYNAFAEECKAAAKKIVYGEQNA